MYTEIKNVQILIGLLKEYDIKHIVTSPGGSSIPIVHSIENDAFFSCYSVVDERSAAYFGMGICQKLRRPVAIVCTSGTAACNYLPAVTEANYQSVPLVIITADKHPYLNRQLVLQVIDQNQLFNDKVKHAVSLPITIENQDDFWYCHRLINEALLELNHHGTGPVHINIPTIGSQSEFNIKKLPKVNAINRISYESMSDIWDSKIKELISAKRILVVFGQHSPYSEITKQHIERFAEKFNCVLSIEHMSNIKCVGSLLTYPVIETSPIYAAKVVAPDLVISLGGNLATYQIRTYLQHVKEKFSHWVIEESGYVKDPFKHLTDIFECTPSYFFKYFTENSPKEMNNDKVYYNKWKELLGNIKIEELPFSNAFASKGLAENIPDKSILHLGILNSTRHMQFFNLDKSIEVYSNIGALGIDGSLSSFLGQASVCDGLAFIILGDLSFFYDMNAARIKHVGSNVRILLVNNAGAGEFHFYVGRKNIPSIDDFISVKHSSTAKGWVESCGFKYLAASTIDEFNSAITSFVITESERPILFEVFTDMEKDAEITRQLYNLNNPESKGISKKQIVKKMTSIVGGEEALNKAVKIAHILKEKEL